MRRSDLLEALQTMQLQLEGGLEESNPVPGLGLEQVELGEVQLRACWAHWRGHLASQWLLPECWERAHGSCRCRPTPMARRGTSWGTLWVRGALCDPESGRMFAYQ